MNKAKVHLRKSPRGAAAATAGVFGDNDTVDKEAERAAKLAYQEELKQQVRFLEKCLLFNVAFQLEYISITRSSCIRNSFFCSQFVGCIICLSCF